MPEQEGKRALACSACKGIAQREIAMTLHSVTVMLLMCRLIAACFLWLA
jgi:hypothetical protein